MVDPGRTDTLFSLQRWLGMLLPPPWDIQPTRTEYQGRPSGVVQPVGPALDAGSAYVRDRTQTYEIFLWPEGVEQQPLQSRLEAEQLAETVNNALTKGYKTTGGYRSYCLRIPYFDYADLPLDQDHPEDAVPDGYLSIARNFNIDVRKDPEQDDLFTLALSLTVQTRVQGDTSRFEGPPLLDVTVRPTGP